MAQKMRNEEGSAGVGHNSGDRRELIEDVGAKRLKDADVNVKAVESALRTSRLEQEARESFAAWLAVAHQVFGVGEQAEMDLGDQEAA